MDEKGERKWRRMEKESEGGEGTGGRGKKGRGNGKACII
jgi:hypothetical protein